MKTIFVDYCNIPNMGDQLNTNMLEDLFDIKVRKANKKNVALYGIGSSLPLLLLYRGQSLRTLFKNLWCIYGKGRRSIFKPLYVWGTGFSSQAKTKQFGLLYRNTIFLALRGQLSKERIERIIRKKLDIPLGDGGLLAERWIGDIEKKYQVGIIPHYNEQDAPILEDLKAYYKDSVIINLRESPAEVIKQIASCRYVLSSSLHGLIVADSYHIPNCHIKLYEFGERIRTDGFKFKDYYSAYGLTDEPIFIKKTSDFPTLEEIESRYRINAYEVEQKKETIYLALKGVIESGRL